MLCRICRERKPHDVSKYRSVMVDGKTMPYHHYMWEQAHGKKLPKNWIVHHLNGLKGDNRLENLLAMPRGDHHGRLVEQALKSKIRQLEYQLGILKQ
jgi:hypothetical protein